MEKATVKILYENVDISADISDSLTDFSYMDKTSGEADEITIALHNKDGLWGLEWYPEKGALLDVSLLHGSETLKCGRFYISELSNNGSKSSGSTVTITAISTGIKQGSRTITSHANENKTLKQIATSIAAKYGWTVHGTIPEIKIGRSTQHRETDLHYLARIAATFGVIFSVRDTVITFTSIFDIENSNAIATLGKQELISWDITDKTQKVYIEAISAHYNTDKKILITFKTPAGKVIPYADVTTGNYLNIKDRAENEQQAELISRASIYRANSLQQEGSIMVPGNIRIVAGVNVIVEELGKFSGNYHVVGTTHALTKSGGYTTSAEIKRVGVLAYEQMKEQAAGS